LAKTKKDHQGKTMKSMTGYGEAASQSDAIKITVQVRSLNHRHLDFQLRVPREYLSFEEEIRKAIRERISRGRIDLFIHRFPVKGEARRLELDEELLGQYLTSIKQAKRRFGLAGEIELSLLSRLPDVFHVRELEVNTTGEKRSVFKILEAALRKLERSREREGRQLKADMRSNLRHLNRISTVLQTEAARIALRLKTAFATGGDNSPTAEREGLDPANWVIKGDVSEEVVRLKSHLQALGGVIEARAPVGKKIDFMLQEIQRELNTISSKLPQLPVVQLVLEGKERVEKIREQTQNIE